MELQRVDRLVEDDYTIGYDPVWTAIIVKTWHWPYLKCEFRFEDKPLAHFTAIRLPGSWISFPHFTQSACIFQKANFPKEVNQKQLKSHLRNLFIDRLSRYQKGDKQEITIDLTDLMSGVDDVKLLTSTKYKSRDSEAISSFHLSNKTISFLPVKQNAAIHLSSLPAGVRHKIRKAGRNGITVRAGGIELLDDFYPVYRQNIQRLGSFGLPKRFFENLLTLAADQSKVFIAQKGAKNMGAAILVNFESHTENPWFASTLEGNRQFVTYALHFAMQEMTIIKGIGLYSFGSSTRGSSVEKYKQQWGTFEKSLYLNASHPVGDLAQRYGLVKSILKHIPYQLTMLFDNWVSFRVY
jgi:hypothetical protein